MIFRGRAPLLVGLFVVVLAVGAARDLSRLGAGFPWRNMDEFADFYCAGSALNERASPYSYEPLRTCEHEVNVGTSFRGRLFRGNRAVAVPAPQPAYDFVPFLALARLPADIARVVDALAILAAVAGCVVGLGALGVPIDLAIAALALSTAFVELNTAQIVPFALLALVACGLWLARGRDALAGVAGALTAIEPVAGVPVLAAMLIFVPRARATAVATAVALALIFVGLTGAGGFANYFTRVLPAHASSELLFPFQYSLTYALAYFGVTPALARAAGSLCYGALLIAGLLIAPRAAAILGKRELLAFLPALCAVVGGPFLHQEELCFAIPAVTILAVATRGRARALFSIALCALAIPWIAVWGMKQLLLASALVCAAILLRLRVPRSSGIAAFVAIVAALYLFELHPPRLPVPVPNARAYAPGELAEVEWGDYTAQRASHDPLWFLIKLPVWAALLATVTAAARLGPRSRDASDASRGS